MARVHSSKVQNHCGKKYDHKGGLMMFKVMNPMVQSVKTWLYGRLSAPFIIFPMVAPCCNLAQYASGMFFGYAFWEWAPQTGALEQFMENRMQGLCGLLVVYLEQFLLVSWLLQLAVTIAVATVSATSATSDTKICNASRDKPYDPSRPAGMKILEGCMQ